MTRPAALLGGVLSLVLVAGCTTSSPEPVGSSPPPEPSASVSSTPSRSPASTRSTTPTQSASPTPPPLPKTGWRDGRYVVPCLPGKPTVSFEDGRAVRHGSDVITARVVARGELAGYQSVAIHIVCSGASSSPSSILVYIGAMDGPEYVGLALSPKEYIDLKNARYVDDELEVVGYGFTRRAPLCCPDLLVTKTVALVNGGLTQTGIVREPLKD